MPNDYNPCTDDVCYEGTPGHLAKPDGIACSDGNACTVIDTCHAGVCTAGNLMQCGVGEECANATCVSILCNGIVGLPGSPIRTLGPATSDMVSEDFNGDGTTDIAATDAQNNVVSVLFGFGNGLFGPNFDYAVGANPASIDSTDLNGDGFADLVVANEGGNGVTVLLNDGNGTFTPIPGTTKLNLGRHTRRRNAYCWLPCSRLRESSLTFGLAAQTTTTSLSLRPDAPFLRQRQPDNSPPQRSP